MDRTAINGVPGVMTLESNSCDSCLGGSFLPSRSNSARNLSSSAAYKSILHYEMKTIDFTPTVFIVNQ